MARIEHYEFGQIVVDAKEERRDLGTPGPPRDHRG
jgi:hypothetical protein